MVASDTVALITWASCADASWINENMAEIQIITAFLSNPGNFDIIYFVCAAIYELTYNNKICEKDHNGITSYHCIGIGCAEKS